jgi:hypothetical protein
LIASVASSSPLACHSATLVDDVAVIDVVASIVAVIVAVIAILIVVVIAVVIGVVLSYYCSYYCSYHRCQLLAATSNIGDFVLD